MDIVFLLIAQDHLDMLDMYPLGAETFSFLITHCVDDINLLITQ